MSWVRKLELHHFRCYESARLDDLSAAPVVLYGPNGAGKTNILEAVSFLSPGRGIRNARIAEIQKNDSDPNAAWAVSALMDTSYGEVRIGTGRDLDKDKRLIRINSEPAKGQNVLAEYLSCVWLTPQMDRIFLDGSSARRRFLDRLVFAFDPSHSGRITRFENAMSQRSKILKEQEHPDPSWLSGLEVTMAETGVAIAAARQEFVGRLQKACRRAQEAETKFFPVARMAMSGTLEELLVRAPALEVEEMYKYQLVETRQRDAVTGGAATGPHKSDLMVWYDVKNMAADQCSTGEQKALLIGLILAHSRLITAERGAPPIVLLDEVAAHLDEDRRAALYELLLAMNIQVWMTGTDRNLFDALDKKAQFFAIENSFIEPDLMGKAA